jgi:hypothetical protein
VELVEQKGCTRWIILISSEVIFLELLKFTAESDAILKQ